MPQHSAMLTDLYQLTMAQAYFDAGLGEAVGCFHLNFRENPFGGGFSVACGMDQAAEWLEAWRFGEEDVDYLATLSGADGGALFKASFLERLLKLGFVCDVDAVEDGTIVFPGEPILRISGPLPVCQLVETALLTTINFQTLIATKAARCRLAAGDDRLLEFGLRRAQGPDGGISASRAAYVGGCDATSNVAAGRLHGIPVAGTHAHSWVMAFDTELEAFEAFAKSMPNNVTLLVDTYDTLQGVRHAVKVAESLAVAGHTLIGIRIDSGDLAWLSRRAREILDGAGLHDTRIVASNELDEHLIASLKEQNAAIDVWGVGTKLVTGWDQPALGGVYKLSAIRDSSGRWLPRIKVSEQTTKTTLPGVLGVRRFRGDEGELLGDMVYDLERDPLDAATIIDPSDPTRRKSFASGTDSEELLKPLFESGRRVRAPEHAALARARCLANLAQLDPSICRFLNPHTYAVGLERGVHDLRSALLMAAKGISAEDATPSREAIAEAEALVEPIRRGRET